MSEVILRCDGLRKTYRGTTAVADLSFQITAGETYGLLGPNGAGKTTAISMIVGVLAGDAGEVTVAGRRPGRAARALIGFVPQELALYHDLTGRENLRFFARLYGLAGRDLRSRTDEILTTVGLADRADEKVATYSGGMARRLHIGVGLVNRPRLLVLDEPTAGVDPQSRNAILASVAGLAGEGIAVLYTTHYMAEAERLCDRVGILDAGRLRAEGTRRELVTLVGQGDRVNIELTGDVAAATRTLARLPEVRQVAGDGHRLTLLADDARAVLPEALAALAADGAGVRTVEIDEPDLEAVFLHLTGKALRD